MKKIIIAIDGPAASGKSTAARLLAQKTGYLYLDTGAMYRACAVAALESGVDIENDSALDNLLKDLHIEVQLHEAENRIILNGRDISAELRKPEISNLASRISAKKAVRQKMVALQREMGKDGGVILDGRDIGTVVFPDAQLKIYLDASPAERAKRRYEELLEKGHKQDYDAVLADILQRDTADSSRALAPLKPAEDAIIIDSTLLSIEALNLLIYTEYLRRMV